tara:strand:- start:416 stop:1411 length:996 start_codon:yes stop_codon:yes gene_type:complete
MIAKPYEIEKIDFSKKNLILLHGDNEGAKKETISKILTIVKKKALNYEEKQILENKDEFYNEILSKSLFDDEKFLIIKRATNKILNVIEDIYQKNISGVYIVINASALEKKSKLRNLFEKKKDLLCLAYYPDTTQILANLGTKFFKDKKINISQSDINLIANRCNGDREIFFNELKKIEVYSLNKKQISSQEIAILTNLIENHDISELVNFCLAKNKRKTVNILNENNFSNEDCIIIARTFLSKSKKVLLLSSEYEKNKNIELTISSAKPPIFWKDKEITKEQISQWEPKKLKKLIYKLHEIELLIKKNINNSINIVTNFILEQVYSNTNN